jgi:hypothetical protein
MSLSLMAAAELLDEVQMRACNLYSGLDYPETPHLFLGWTPAPPIITVVFERSSLI